MKLFTIYATFLTFAVPTVLGQLPGCTVSFNPVYSQALETESNLDGGYVDNMSCEPL